MRAGRAPAWRNLRVTAFLVWDAHASAALAALVSTAALGAVPVVTAWVTKLLVDRLAASRGVVGPLFVGLVVGSLVAAAALRHFGEAWIRYLEAQLGRRVSRLTQDRLFTKINSFAGSSWFERPQLQDQMQLAQQAGQVAPQLVAIMAGVMQQSVTIAGFVVVVVAISPLLALVTLAVAVPQLLAQLRLAGQRVRLLEVLSPHERREFFYRDLQLDPRAAKELRLFGLGSFFHRRMLDELSEIHAGEQALDRRELRVTSLLGVLAAVLLGVALWLVVDAGVEGTITSGDVVLILAALAGISSGVIYLVGQIAQASETIGIVGYYDELVGAQTALESAPRGSAAASLKEGIVFEDVWFRYGDELPWVLKGVNLRIPAGCSIGLVGRNGAGKSTIVKLLGRLYEPTEGRILWDGINLSTLDHESLRARIGMVFQDYMTYDLTAAENIGVGDLEHIDDRGRIQRAAELAGVAEAIERLPARYDTMLSRLHVGGSEDSEETGVLLSGGQWQRLALARMLMRADRDLLILDEPSSGLDAEAEHYVNRIVHGKTSGRTRLLISQRLNAVRVADRILVLENGVIIEEGSHAQLLAAGGRYAQLFTLQASGYRAEEEYGGWETPIPIPPPAGGVAAGSG